MQQMRLQQQLKVKSLKKETIKTKIDGFVFNSPTKAKYYQHLKCLEEAHQILFFRVRPRYLLNEIKKDGSKYEKNEYIGDFEVHKLDGTIEVIDIKDLETDVLKIKQKLFHKRYPHKISVLTFDSIHGWVELKKLKKMNKKERNN